MLPGENLTPLSRFSLRQHPHLSIETHVVGVIKSYTILMKTLVYIGLFAGSTLGTWAGSLIDHNALFGPWSIACGAIGAFVGIWVGYKIGQNYL